MFKRLISVTLLLLLCIGISVWSFFVVENISTDLINDLTEFLKHAENNDFSNALNKINSCNEKLKTYEKTYAVFLEHGLFEELLVTVPSIMYLYETDNEDEAMDKCFESIETLKIIIHEQKLCYENIF